ncbi:hypothetical protein GWO43_15670 [candidate division KSB1 bacterium]|nr:hypothetical protein [candidate division KSB1 bacterium]NIR68519.1 hypothetical protein [candidate division KSB1 bacterium]NIS25395.1 hypothetical protein [candidate division KSB1 bacterium]NIT72281.1 hypothetical protein [candidate division KSB1 bacterium]NIU89375.1 hypothetical protein [candidate division KSB1 bacterium]
MFYTRTGSSDLVKDAKLDSAETKITRSINEDNVATPPTRPETTIAKKIVSFDAKVDVTLEDRNEDPETELAQETLQKARDASWRLQEMFFEADTGSDSEDFDGMRQLVHASWKLTDGVLVPVGGSDSMVEAQQLAIEKFLQHSARVRGGASHAYMNEFLKIRWLTIAKHLGYYRQSKDELGSVIEMIGNVILRGAGYKENGNTLLPFNKSVGGFSNTSEIFFVRWGERTDLTLLTSVGVRGRFAGQIGNFLVNNINMDAVMHAQNRTALVQSQGWRLDTP